MQHYLAKKIGGNFKIVAKIKVKFPNLFAWKMWQREDDRSVNVKVLSQRSSRINYFVDQLDDLKGGFGWNGDRFPSLPERLQFPDPDG